MALTYAGIDFESVAVDLKTHTLVKDGSDYYKVSRI